MEPYNLGAYSMKCGCLYLDFPSSGHCDKDSNTEADLRGDSRKYHWRVNK